MYDANGNIKKENKDKAHISNAKFVKDVILNPNTTFFTDIQRKVANANLRESNSITLNQNEYKIKIKNLSFDKKGQDITILNGVL
ncbi:MAG: hypothetical protein K6E76_08385 [Patescibacteria group bacterium]|nr:hypothetical protein [Patescibacteria group bacterium]